MPVCRPIHCRRCARLAAATVKWRCMGGAVSRRHVRHVSVRAALPRPPGSGPVTHVPCMWPVHRHATGSADSQARGGVDSDPAETPDSVEQGQTQMPESFEHRPVAGPAPRIASRRIARYHDQCADPLLLPRPRQFQHVAKRGLDAGGFGGSQDRLLRQFRRVRLHGLYLAAPRGSLR